MPWSFWVGYVEKLAIVALVLVGFYAVAWRLRQVRPFARSDRCMNVLDSMMLSQHAALYVVRVGTRYFLIGGSASGVRRLSELTESSLKPRSRV